MNMFGRGPGTEQSAPEPLEIPELVDFQIKRTNGKWETVKGHGIQVAQNGYLTVVRAVFIDEECRQPSPMGTFGLAPSEWVEWKTDYAGYQPKSELAIH